MTAASLTSRGSGAAFLPTAKTNRHRFNSLGMTYRDEATLRRLYLDEGKPAPEIADKFGVSNRTIYNWMDKFGIERRSHEDKHTRGSGRNGLDGDPVPLDINPSTGYRRWKTGVNDKHHTVRVHRLVAVAEYGFDAVVGKVVHHENEMKLDNRHDNLELMDNDDHLHHHSQQGERGTRPSSGSSSPPT